MKSNATFTCEFCDKFLHYAFYRHVILGPLVAVGALQNCSGDGCSPEKSSILLLIWSLRMLSSSSFAVPICETKTTVHTFFWAFCRPVHRKILDILSKVQASMILCLLSCCLLRRLLHYWNYFCDKISSRIQLIPEYSDDCFAFQFSTFKFIQRQKWMRSNNDK